MKLIDKFKTKKEIDALQAPEKPSWSIASIFKPKESEQSFTGNFTKRKLSKKDLMVLLIPCGAALLAVLIIMLTVSKGSRYTFRADARQYYGGSSVSIEQGTKLKRTEDGAVRYEKTKTIPDRLPAYLDSEKTAVLMDDMLYYTPHDNKFGLLRAFTEVSISENGLLTASFEKKEMHPEKGFIFDGNDIYLFMEPMRVTCNGYTIELPALSYAEVVNGSHVMLLNYENKNVFYEKIEGAVFAESRSGDYKISLLGDSYTKSTGEKLLLASRPEIFDPLV